MKELDAHGDTAVFKKIQPQGDPLREQRLRQRLDFIYVIPESGSHCYVVLSDHPNSTSGNADERRSGERGVGTEGIHIAERRVAIADGALFILTYL